MSPDGGQFGVGSFLMTPDEFLRSIEKRDPQPAYLFLGPKAGHVIAAAALDRAHAGPEDREEGLTRHDLSEVELSAVIDDARSFSLFANRPRDLGGKRGSGFAEARHRRRCGGRDDPQYLERPSAQGWSWCSTARDTNSKATTRRNPARREVLLDDWIAGRVRAVHSRRGAQDSRRNRAGRRT